MDVGSSAMQEHIAERLPAMKEKPQTHSKRKFIGYTCKIRYFAGGA